MRVRFARFAAWIALVTYAVAGLAPCAQVVLCFGPDGHVAFEVADAERGCDGCLHEPDGPFGTGDEDEAAVEGGACPCVDIPLPSEGEARAQVPGRDPLAVGAPASPALAAPAIPASASGACSLDPARTRALGRVPRDPRPLRSVVLRF